MDGYRFNEAASAIYQFLWHEFCDWYIELIKPALYQDQDPGRKWVAQDVLARVLDRSLRLLHPFMPFITEEIWQTLPGNEGSIMVAEFPRFRQDEVYPGEEARMELLMKVVGAVRNLRSEMEIAPAKKVEVILYCQNPEILKVLRENRSYAENLARIETIAFQSEGPKPKASATSIVEEVEVFLPLRGLINLDEEERRLQKDLTKVSEDLSRAQRKLQNQDFVGTGPAGGGGEGERKGQSPCRERGQAQGEPGEGPGLEKGSMIESRIRNNEETDAGTEKRGDTEKKTPS